MSFLWRHRYWVIILLIVTTAFYALHRYRSREAITLETIYGTIEVQDPCLLEIMRSSSVERMKGVHQYGMLPYATPIEPYSRYDHSVGIFALLQRYGCERKTLITGFLQDVSHTAFSHLANFVFDIDVRDHAYHEDIHLWFLRHSGLAEILERYGYHVEDVHPENGNFPILEQPLPSLCANRIEYNLQGGLRRGLLSEEEVNNILDHLRYEEPHWYFTDKEAAKKLGQVSLHMTENLGGAAWVLLLCTWVSESVKHAIDTGWLSLDDFHFSQDDEIWRRLLASNDPYIRERMRRVRNFDHLYQYTSQDDQDLLLAGKFRGVDPLVLTKDGLRPLTTIDTDYKREFNKVRDIMQQGWSLKLVTSDR